MASQDRYEHLRDRFEELETDDRARFLLEASVSTLATGLEQLGEVLADSLEQAMRSPDRASDSAEGARQPGPAEPETAQRHAPHGRGTSASEK